MSVGVAITLGVASAVVYGASTVVQHGVVHRTDGEPDARGLLAAVRDPRWLMAVGGDSVGFLLQVGALTQASVVLVQPLVVLMLPVALIIGYAGGGPRPDPGELVGGVVLVAGLAVFLTLIGEPGQGQVPQVGRAVGFLVVVLTAGVLVCVAITGMRAVVRGALFGLVAGAWFGMLGVFVDAASRESARRGLVGLIDSPRGYVWLIGIALLGLGGTVLTQVSFQVGALAATLPANLSADPLAAVVIGSVLLGERVPLGPWHLLGYSLCLVAVVAGALRLAASHTVDGS